MAICDSNLDSRVLVTLRAQMDFDFPIDQLRLWLKVQRVRAQAGAVDCQFLCVRRFSLRQWLNVEHA